MYKEELTNKLKDIFGVQSVIYNNFTLGKEQSVIFVNVYNERIHFSKYKNSKYCRVEGRLELCGNSKQFYSGWFHEKFAIANEIQKKGLSLSSNETTIQFSFNQKMFNQLSVDFEYSVCNDDWDRERRKIKTINWEVNLNE